MVRLIESGFTAMDAPLEEQLAQFDQNIKTWRHQLQLAKERLEVGQANCVSQPARGTEPTAPISATRSMGADCTHASYGLSMSKVMQIRDIPDEVHHALAEAAEAEGLSLTRYMLRELEHLAKRALIVQNNEAVIRRTQSRVSGNPDRGTILSVLHEGRGD